MLAEKAYTFLFRLIRFLVRWVWKHLPESILSTTLFRACGKRIHEAISRKDRKSVGGHCRCTDTQFFRNTALLEVLRDLAARKARGNGLSIASIGCSTGAELYSLLWFIRCARPDLEIKACGLDVSESVIAKARAGIFSKSDKELAYLSETDVAALFDSEGEMLRIKPFLSRGLKWLVADALDPALSKILEPQDIVLANNFVGPFFEEKAEKCLLNISRVVKPNGYMVVFGMDLDLRTRWVKRQGYLPITDRIEQVHVGDRALLDWPWTRWGLEPLDKGCADWQTRYAVVFQVPDTQIEHSDCLENKPSLTHN
jgi:chemotaxis methyl-accepting protein methylase